MDKEATVEEIKKSAVEAEPSHLDQKARKFKYGDKICFT